MDFMTAAKKGFENLTYWKGKSGVAEFWWYALAAFLVSIVGYAVLFTIFGYLGAIVASLGSVALLFSATMRRMNDAGKPVAVAYAFFAVGILTSVIPLAALAYLILLVIMIYFLVQPSV